MISRDQLRASVAQHLNSLSKDDLFRRFEITRVGCLTGLDTIGLPVYSVARPSAATVSVNAGKSTSLQLARAGAIAEGIEFHTFEHPVGGYRFGRYNGEIDRERFPLIRGQTWRLKDKIAYEPIFKYGHGLIDFPSDMVWLGFRREKKWIFPKTSNGQAVGATLEDCLVQGICEVVERDAVTIRTMLWDELGIIPPKVDLKHASDSTRHLVQMVENAELRLLLFSCTLDILFPVYWAVLVDPYGGLASFGGWGCAIGAEQAANRAILEAVQSRAVYIAGARDDILRRNFERLQAIDPKDMVDAYDAAPAEHIILPDGKPESLDTELRIALQRLGSHCDNLYWKQIELGDVMVAKTMVLGLEPPIIGNLWKPGPRANGFYQHAKQNLDLCRS